jgi:murein DD-endopeptidase MepM/ murein hydrolase activator NlpD
MSLLPPVANALIGLEFGPTTISYEPPAYGTTTKANFHSESGFTYYSHFHTGRDYAANEGTPIVASESGKVVYSGWDSTGGGEKIAVQIRPGTIYSDNHCERLYVPLGANVKRGQVIATVGETGAAHGFHDHFWVQIDEIVNGYLQHNLWNPKLLMAGGSMADDPRIKPLVQYVELNGAGINIRTGPYLTASVVFADSRNTPVKGIYRGSPAVKIAEITAKMTFMGWYKGTTDFGTNLWAKVHFYGKDVFVKKELLHFV